MPTVGVTINKIYVADIGYTVTVMYTEAITLGKGSGNGYHIKMGK